MSARSEKRCALRFASSLKGGAGVAGECFVIGCLERQTKRVIPPRSDIREKQRRAETPTCSEKAQRATKK